jgi:2,5-dioxopentanoate dehydrogenase
MSGEGSMFDGAMLIGGTVRHSAVRFSAVHPANGEASPLLTSEAQPDDVADACALAEAALAGFSPLASESRAAFLECVAEAIEGIGDILIDTACAETGLPRARLEGERGRTTGSFCNRCGDVPLGSRTRSGKFRRQRPAGSLRIA